MLQNVRDHLFARDHMPTAERPRGRSRGLSAAHFRKVAVNGFGDPANSYAYSYAWYDGHLFIGTIRNLLVLIKKRLPLNTPSACWPVPLPDADEEIDLCAQIWKYSPITTKWERVYRSPMTRGVDNYTVPLSSGFRNMAVFQGKTDRRPAIYTVASCGTYGLGPVLMCSPDGVDFEVASEPGLGLGDTRITTFRGVMPFKGLLFMAPVGSRGGYCNMSYNAVIICSDDPASSRFELSNEPSFGEPTNMGIYDFCVSGDYLYASTANFREGFQIWRTDAEGPPPHKWTKMLDRGADRGPYNEAAICLASFQGDLYMGTAIQNGGFDQINQIGPAAGEVIRMHPDGSWDLVMGEPRMTRQGFKSPSSGMGPGFDNAFAGYIWRMCAHDGSLYVGTYDASSFLPFSDPDRWPAWSRKLVDPEMMNRFMELRGGCELWRTNDGDNWVAVTRNGFDNPYNYGFRTLISTPVGLFVGSANPFGPKVAVWGASGWRYEENPRGGIEVWQGALEHAGRGDPVATAPCAGDSAPWLRIDDCIASGLVSSLIAGTNGGRDGSSGLEAVESCNQDMLRSLLDGICSDAPAAPGRTHDFLQIQAGRDRGWEYDPVQRLARSDSDLSGLVEELDDELNEFFGDTGLQNVGFWTWNTKIPRSTCRQLLDEMTGLVMSTGDRGEFSPKSILAIGSGALTIGRALLDRWPSAAVSAALGESEQGFAVDSLDPRISTVPWQASGLPAEDRSCDLIFWVDSPTALNDEATLNEIRRVLRPGGRLVASELIGIPVECEYELMRASGGVSLVADYTAAIEKAGLRGGRVVDVTERSWVPFFKYSREFFSAKLLCLQIDQEQHDRILGALPGGGLAVVAYLLVTAAKTQEP